MSKDKSADVITTAILITPEIARSYLAKSKVNRKINPAIVRSYADQMAQGQWTLTNQGIGFAGEDHLIDGHHRLNAVILSQCSVWMNVTIGLTESAGAKVDVGYKREPGHILWMLYQVPNATSVAAIGKAFLFCDEKITRLSQSADPADLFVAYSNNKDAFALGREAQKVCSAAMSGALAYAYRIDPPQVIDFVKKISSKVGIEANSPEQSFLRWVESTAKKGGNGGMARQKEVIYAVSSALVHKFANTPMAFLRPAEGALEVIRKKRKAKAQ
jgi:hypothetical protein